MIVKYSIVDLYTDDAELHCSHLDLSVVEACLQSDLDAVAGLWLCSSCLCLNVVKSVLCLYYKLSENCR